VAERGEHLESRRANGSRDVRRGFELVIPERSGYLADVKDAMKNPNVKFKVCAIALRNNNINTSQLLPGVETVPDGIYELVSKQQDHWGYIKVMH
jgi:hypothetical protein